MKFSFFSIIAKVLVFLSLMYHISYSQDLGTIQVMCERDVKIFLDGIYKGTTTDLYGGIIIQNVPTGTHKIKSIKEGFSPQEEKIILRRGQVLLFSVKPFSPSINIHQEGDESQGQIKRKVGSILIQSIPVTCKINIPNLGIENQYKSKDKWSATNVPIGEYTASFTSLSTTLNYSFVLTENKTIHLMVNFLDKNVIEKGQTRGTLNVNSNKLGLNFNLFDIKRKINLNLKTPVSEKFYPSEYRLKWNDNINDRSISFQIDENKKTFIQIPFYKKLTVLNTIENHKNFVSFNDFLSNNFIPLKESERLKRSVYKSRSTSRNKVKGFGYSIVLTGAVSTVIGLTDMDNENAPMKEFFIAGLVTTVAGLGIYALGNLFDYTDVYYNKSIPSNIAKNNARKATLAKDYDKLSQSWQKDIDEENQEIETKNRLIEKENNEIPSVNISYK